MVVYNNILAGASGVTTEAAEPYSISKSLRFNPGDSPGLSKTFATAGNQRTWTWSGWMKRTGLTVGSLFSCYTGTNSDAGYFDIVFGNSNQLNIGGWTTAYLRTTRVFRDPSAWYHIVIAVDTTQSTSTDRLKLYINGVQETQTDAYNVTQNRTFPINSANRHSVGSNAYYTNTTYRHNGYLAEVHFVDGQQLAPTDFGEFDSNNVWQPKKFNHGTAKHTGDWVGDTVGTPYGSAVNGSDKAFDGNDSTGAAPNTGTAFVFTPSTPITGISKVRIRAVRDASQSDDDGLQLNGTEIGSNWTAGAAVSEVEITVNNLTSLRWETNSISHWYKVYKIEIYYDGAYHTLVPGDINSFNLDFNDTTSNQALGYDASVSSPSVNNKGGFDAIKYSGTGSAQTVKGLAFQPDLVWVKRTNLASDHQLYDSVRGVHKGLSSDQAIAEWEYSNGLTSFNSDGFSVGSLGGLNNSGDSHIAWAWKAGGPAVSNTDGSITSQVSASDKYGFSVVSYTGATGAQTVGHGLSSAPKFIIAKNRDSSSDWIVYHEDLDSSNPEDKFLRLNQTNTTTTSADYWGSGGVTNSVFGVDNGILINTNSQKVIAYCWSEVSGYSKFGSYSGGTNPKTVTTGFKPRFLLIKRTDTANHWMLIDSERGGTQKLGADTNVEENNLSTLGDASQNIVEFLDDGFKLTTTNAGTNVSGGTYVYAAFGDRAGNNWSSNNLIATAGLETAKQGMDVVTYTGNAGNQTISGLQFQPDLIWLKSTDASHDHWLFDSVRGLTKAMYSNANSAEYNYSPNGVSSVSNTGFTINGSQQFNSNGTNYVGWCWKAGGTASSNSDGSITSSVSANQTYGFSVATFSVPGSTPYTVGHGLGSVPKLIILKSRTGTANWNVYHASTGNQSRSYLNLTNSASSGESCWNNTSPTSSVFSMGSSGEFSGDMVAYCWSEVSGFSKFSSYTGTGAAGRSVTTGFKPKWVLIKETGNAGNWFIYDSARGTTNILWANTSDSESAIGAGDGTNQNALTINNTGFSIPHTLSGTNRSGGTYIYAAFADKPPGEIIDSMIDTPMNIEADSGNNPGNYATLNPLNTNTNQTLSDGNLKCAATANQWGVAPATIAITSGKYYFESTLTGNNYHYIGIANKDSTILDSVTSTNDYWGKTSNDWGYQSGGTIIHNGGNLGWGTQTSYGTGDVVALAFDADTKTTKWYKNGTQIHTGTISGSAPFFVGVGAYGSGSFSEVNFGQRPFAYTPPTNHKSLCTTNLPDPTIADGSTAFDVKLWTGNSGTQTISGLGFSPDMVWVKCRSNGGTSHHITDAVRGANKSVFPNGNNAEATYTTYLTAFTSDGFTLGSGSEMNYSSRTFVGWAWDAGSSTVSNTDGSITSNVRANPSAGFSVVKFEGDRTAGSTVGHGLNAAPELVIVKNRESSSNWMVYHKGAGHGGYLALNTNAAYGSASSVWNNTAPTSSVFTLGADSESNGNGSDMIAYCFTSVENYSSIGSFDPNGTTDNSFVYTGFRPKFILLKYSSHAGDWLLLDTSRRPNGPAGGTLVANVDNAEDSYYTSGQANIDFLSNGFKIRVTGSPFGDSGRTVVYAAFAEHPFKYSRAY